MLLRSSCRQYPIDLPNDQFKKGTLEFCGVKPVKVTSIAPVKDSSQDFRQHWLRKVNAFGVQDVRLSHHPTASTFAAPACSACTTVAGPYSTPKLMPMASM